MRGTARKSSATITTFGRFHAPYPNPIRWRCPDRPPPGRRRVVDAVADHRHNLPRLSQRRHGRLLLPRQHFGLNTLDTDLASHRRGGLAMIARQQQHLEAQRLELFDGFAAMRIDRVWPRRSVPGICHPRPPGWAFRLPSKRVDSVCARPGNAAEDNRLSFPTSTSPRFPMAKIPCPGAICKLSTGANGSPACWAARTIGSASGCLLNCSTEAAVANSSSD